MPMIKSISKGDGPPDDFHHAAPDSISSRWTVLVVSIVVRVLVVFILVNDVHFLTRCLFSTLH